MLVIAVVLHPHQGSDVRRFGPVEGKGVGLVDLDNKSSQHKDNSSETSLLGAKLFSQLHIVPLHLLDLFLRLLGLFQPACLQQLEVFALGVVRLEGVFVHVNLSGLVATLKALR